MAETPATGIVVTLLELMTLEIFGLTEEGLKRTLVHEPEEVSVWSLGQSVVGVADVVADEGADVVVDGVPVIVTVVP